MTGEETYFGIQAMDDDLEVDGLWNSKTSTPLHTPLTSPIIKGKDSYSLRSALAKISHSRHISPTSSISKADVFENSSLKLGRAERQRAIMDRSVSENVNLLRSVHHAQPDDSLHCQTSRSRSASNPSPDVHSIQIPVTGLGTADEFDTAGQHAESRSILPVMHTKMMNHNHNSVPPRKKGRTVVIGETINSTNGIDEILQAVSALQNTEVIDHMEAHRSFLAAESSQLRPRPDHMRHSTLTITRDPSKVEHAQFQSTRSISWPVTQNETILSMTVPQNKPQRRITPPVTPFRAFVEMHPPPKMCPSAWTERTQVLMNEKLEPEKRVSTFTITASTRSRSSSASSDMGSVVTASESSPTSEGFSVNDIKTHEFNDTIDVSTEHTSEEELPIRSRGRRFRWSGKSMADDNKPARLKKIFRTRSRSRSDVVSTDETTYQKDPVHGMVTGVMY